MVDLTCRLCSYLDYRQSTMTFTFRWPWHFISM